MEQMAKTSEALNILASNMIRLRNDRRWTQIDLAVEAGVGVGVIKKAETRQSLPRIQNLDAIAGALKISTQELLGAQAPPAPTTPTIQELAKTITDQAAEIARLKSKLEEAGKSDIPDDIADALAKWNSRDWDIVRAVLRIPKRSKKVSKRDVG